MASTNGLVSPEIFASKINQLNAGGVALIIIKIIIIVKKALNVFVFIFLLIKSKFCIPEYSILIKWRPITPKINGRKKLIESGKKAVALTPKKELKETSAILTKNRNTPKNRYT